MQPAQPVTAWTDTNDPWPWRELLVVVIVPVLLGLALKLVGQESAVSLLKGWLRMNGDGGDSWGPMRAALGDAVRGVPIYQDLFFTKQLKFQYPPTSLLLHQILALITIDPTPELFNRLNWFLVLANASIAAWFGISVSARLEGSAPNSYQRLAIGVLCFWAALCFYPIMNAWTLGQAQIWIDVLFSLSCLAWLYQKKHVSGALVGLICLIKPQFCLFAVWGLLRGERHFVYGWLAVTLAGVALSIDAFGLLNHLDYLAVLNSLARTGESFHANQSINGILNRLLDNGPVLAWEANGFPPYNSIIRWGTLASSAAIIAAALLYRRRRPAGLLDFQLAALAFTMASPIAWTHHYGILPLVYIAAYFQAKVLRDAGHRKLCHWALALSYLLTANYLGTTQALAGSPLNLLYSYVFFGATLLVLALYLLTRPGWAGPGVATLP